MRVGMILLGIVMRMDVRVYLGTVAVGMQMNALSAKSLAQDIDA